jgi:hypothetical protein
MRRLAVRGMAVLGLVGLVGTACTRLPSSNSVKPVYQVTYTVEFVGDNFQVPIDIKYTGADGDTVQEHTNGRTPSFFQEVTMSASFLDVYLQAYTEYQGAKLKCTIAINGVVVSQEKHPWSQCLLTASLSKFTGPASPPATPVTRPPTAWPPTSAPPTPRTTAKPKPRPAICKYASDAEVTAIVQNAGGPPLFSHVQVGVGGGCLYHFTELPGGATIPNPLAGVTVIWYPGLAYDIGPDHEPIPGLKPAHWYSSGGLVANVAGGGLSIIVTLGRSEALDETVAKAVYRLVRTRL